MIGDILHLVIGGTGHIGSYLVPRLLQSGHGVAVVARHSEPQYTHPRLNWPQVEWITADRHAEEQSGAWSARMRQLEADAVIDLICYTPEQHQVMMEAFAGRISHFLHCGTIWAYGPAERTPYQEHYPRRPITDYGMQKAAIETALHQTYRESGLPTTVVHPGHISGRRWLPIDPQGTRNGTEIYSRLAAGKTIQLPDTGLATLHHVHGDDVAQLFELALDQPRQAAGQSFSAVAPYALSLVACARFVAGLFGRLPQIEYVPLPRMEEFVGKTSFQTISDHVKHSPCASIAKGQRLLGYQPRYTTEQIYTDSIAYLLESGQLQL